MRVHAHAKINLSLEVLGRRPDGYHELVSVMQTLALADELEIQMGDAPDFTCSDTDLVSDNLVLRASALLADRYPAIGSQRVRLEKNIPVGAGLGGGSSDAASTLCGLSALYGLPGSPRDLHPLAAELGSDVPYFLSGGTCVARGRGERIEKLPSLPATWVLLANPGIRVSTAEIYHALPTADWSDGRSVEDQVLAIRQGQEVTPGPNALTATLFRLYPEARACYEALQAQGPGRAAVSGSGPTAYGLFSTRLDAQSAQRALGTRYWTAVTQTWTP